MFTSYRACKHCGGAGCDDCQWTGFPNGRIPATARAWLEAQDLDPEEMAEDVRTHPANKNPDW